MAMTTTVVIMGSPRKGNSEGIAMAIANVAKEKGNTIKTFKLNQLKDVKGCQSCYGCKKAGKCVVKDGHTEVLDAIRDADSIIFATPTYFGRSSGQFRLLEDRFFSFLNGDFSPNIKAGKKVAIIETCGTGFDGAKVNAAGIEGAWTNFFKAEIVGMMVVGDMMAPDAYASNDVVQAKIKEIGSKL